MSSQACGIIAGIEQVAEKTGTRAWAVCEAGTGIVRAVVDAENDLVREAVEENGGASIKIYLYLVSFKSSIYFKAFFNYRS